MNEAFSRHAKHSFKDFWIRESRGVSVWTNGYVTVSVG